MDEASEMLGIPRPTLYRYLREYSIAHIRRSGRIFIPEDSLEKIRNVRDLHREGMGTGSVRRALRDRESNTSENSQISLRLEKLSSELEGMKLDPVRKSGTEDLSSAQALRTILARQSLLISAVFNLTEMVEEIMRSNGYQPRRNGDSENVGEKLRLLTQETESPAEALTKSEFKISDATFNEERATRSSSLPVQGNRAAIRLPSPPTRGYREVEPARRSGFGTLARRRRRNSILFSALILAGCVLLLVYAFWFAA